MQPWLSPCTASKEIILWFCFTCFRQAAVFTPQSHQALLLLSFVFKGSSQNKCWFAWLPSCGILCKRNAVAVDLSFESLRFWEDLTICWTITKNISKTSCEMLCMPLSPVPKQPLVFPLNVTAIAFHLRDLFLYLCSIPLLCKCW